MGICSLIGVKNTIMFFFKKSKLRGSAFFFAGFILIIIGWYLFTTLGFFAQLYGIFLLFRSFIKTIFSYCQTLPVIGPILRKSPFIRKLVDWISQEGGSKNKA